MRTYLAPSDALLCAVLRSPALYCLLSCALMCALLRSCALSCVFSCAPVRSCALLRALLRFCALSCVLSCGPVRSPVRSPALSCGPARSPALLCALLRFCALLCSLVWLSCGPVRSCALSCAPACTAACGPVCCAILHALLWSGAAFLRAPLWYRVLLRALLRFCALVKFSCALLGFPGFLYALLCSSGLPWPFLVSLREGVVCGPYRAPLWYCALLRALLRVCAPVEFSWSPGFLSALVCSPGLSWLFLLFMWEGGVWERAQGQTNRKALAKAEPDMAKYSRL